MVKKVIAYWSSGNEGCIIWYAQRSLLNMSTSHTENMAQQQKVVEEQMYMQNEGLKNKNRY